MRKRAEVAVPRRFRTVVTSGAGYPLDRTYYQTVKGMVCAIDILEPGGTIIIASECSEGMGSDEFVAAQRLLRETGPDRFLSVLERRDKALIDEWQTEMLLKALRVGTVKLYTTGLGKEGLKDVCRGPGSLGGSGGRRKRQGPRRPGHRRGAGRPVRDPAVFRPLRREK